jgi:O-antigen ligase
VGVFKEYPILGAGINAFEPAYRGLGIFLDPEYYNGHLPHPHNIYLQFLAETGVIGFAILLVFLFGQLIYGYKALRHKAKALHDPWLIASCLWCSSVGYMVTAISAHNFFRTWWLGLAMTVFGAAMGSALLANKKPD